MAEGDIHLYGSGVSKLLTGDIDLDTDTLKLALLTGHTLDTATHDFFDDVSADEVSGDGYTAGGETISNPSVTFTAADDWATQWAASTAYEVGDIVRPTTGNGFLYRVVTAGTSDGSEPTWSTTLGETVDDNTVVWEVWATGIVQFDADDVSWTGLDAGTPSHAVLYKDTGTESTSALVLAMEISTASNGGNYTVAFDGNGVFVLGVVI